MKNEALNGRKYVRQKELTDEQRELYDRRLAQINGLDYDEVRSDHIFG